MVKDGRFAGQTVEHVHVHIIPRNKNDYIKKCEIYDEIAQTSFEMKKLLEERRLEYDIESRKRRTRTPYEMAAEAIMLKNYLERGENVPKDV